MIRNFGRFLLFFSAFSVMTFLSGLALGNEVRENATAVFAGGCFWCMQPPYDEVEGVLGTEVGFTGGHVENPSYDQVVSGGTGHFEVVRVEYDPETVRYEELLEIFWVNIDPLDDGGQFCDRGAHYRAAIFVANETERALAEASKQSVAQRFDEPVVTEILDAQPFYLAEEYHQDYYQKRPIRYGFYRRSCGRDARLDELWGDKR